jgi:hypothetical protein
MRIEGLLMNSRMVQGIFDDLNPATRDMWVYPDTQRWDPDREHARIRRRDARVAASRTSCLHDQFAGRQPTGPEKLSGNFS